MKFLEKLLSKHERFRYDGENAALVQAMHRLALKDDPDNRKKMYEVLLSSTLLIPTPELPAGSPKDLDGYRNLQLNFSTDDQGNKLTPAFTDIEALRNWDPNTPCLSPHARDFFRIISRYFGDIRGVVINPFDPIRKIIRPRGIITRGEFEVLSLGQIPTGYVGGLVVRELPHAGMAGSIQPTEQTLPPAVAEVLRKSAEGIHEIAALYIFCVAHTHGSPQLTAGVVFDRNVTKERVQLIFQALWSAVAQTKTKEFHSLDLVVMSGQIGVQAQSKGNKIYQRL